MPPHLVESLPLALGVFKHSVADVFVENTIPERDPHDSRNANVEPPRLLIVVGKINRHADDAGAPPIEPKDLIRQVDNLPPLDIRQLRATARTWPLGDVFRA